MKIDDWIREAWEQGASDLHLEPGSAPTVRVRGALEPMGKPVPKELLLEEARALVGDEHWAAFVERCSADLARTIHGVRCRINVLRSSNGIGIAVRLLSNMRPTLAGLNLHPDLAGFAQKERGLVLLCGPTGCGKSSTLAALFDVIDTGKPRHVVTIEKPIEYALRPKRAFVRQREVGRDTPSFYRALLDVKREDPDVIFVGEMRAQRTMRQTLDVAETGHLVFSTVHSSSCIEALQRIASSFHPNIQPSVRSQLADVLCAVVCQRLVYRPELGIRVPECEILVASNAVRNLIRNGDFHLIGSQLEIGAREGQWTLERYRRWMEEKLDWVLPEDLERIRRSETNGRELEAADSDDAVYRVEEPVDAAGPMPIGQTGGDPKSTRQPTAETEGETNVIYLEPSDESIQDILSELEDE